MKRKQVNLYKKNSRNRKKNICKPIIIFPAACPFII